MKFDLKSLTRKELEKLGRDVEKALDKVRQQDLKKVRQEMEKMAAAHGVSVEDVMSTPVKPRGRPKAAKAKVKVAPKYANPENADQKWSGRGRQPEWFRNAIAAGKTPESMAI